MPALDLKTDVVKQDWSLIPGEYFALSKTSPVAISTLASTELAENLANKKPPELSIVGKTETENIGIEKIIKNTLSTPAIRYLIVAGHDTEGHFSGKTILALWENSVNEGMRVIDSPAKNPTLKNVTKEEVEAFRHQVKVIDMIGCEEVDTIIDKIKEIVQNIDLTCDCKDSSIRIKPIEIPNVSVIQAKEPSKIEMDKAGYFVILPLPEKKIIRVEHYSYDNSLIRIIEGTNARNIYWTIIENGWVSQLSHASYIGKELTKAELSIEYRFKYIQDGA